MVNFLVWTYILWTIFFEPFFTTNRGKGSTGLGMNLVYNIVNQQLKGTISVTSEQGVGTFISLTLPHTV